MRLSNWLIVAVLCFSLQQDKPPPLGFTTEAEVVRIIDGDTMEVEISTKVRVRLLDCWAPELREEAGAQAKEYLTGLAKPGSSVVLHIPTEGARRMDDILTFGRILGRVYANGEDVSEQMIESGHATKRRTGD